MTKIIIYKKQSYITGYEVSGHSGYADEGEDIVCSAVSTATQMAALGIKDVIKLQPFIEISRGYMKLRLKKEEVYNDNAQVLLKTMEKTLNDIVKEYGNYVRMEVKKDD